MEKKIDEFSNCFTNVYDEIVYVADSHDNFDKRRFLLRSGIYLTIISLILLHFGKASPTQMDAGTLIAVVVIVGFPISWCLMLFIAVLISYFINWLNTYTSYYIDENRVFHYLVGTELPQNISEEDRDVVYTLLYELYEAENSNKIDDIIEYYSKLKDGSYYKQSSGRNEKNQLEPKSKEVNSFFDKLKNNPQYREEIIDEELPTILRHLIEFETGKRVGMKEERNNEFITTEVKKEPLVEIEQELENAYKLGMDVSVCILSRKLCESALNSFYVEYYAEEEKHIDSERGGFKSLGKLASQFESDIDIFQKYSPEIDRSIIDSIHTIRKTGNHYVHSPDTLSIYHESDVETVREEINTVLEAISLLDSKMGS